MKFQLTPPNIELAKQDKINNNVHFITKDIMGNYFYWDKQQIINEDEQQLFNLIYEKQALVLFVCNPSNEYTSAKIQAKINELCSYFQYEQFLYKYESTLLFFTTTYLDKTKQRQFKSYVNAFLAANL